MLSREAQNATIDLLQGAGVVAPDLAAQENPCAAIAWPSLSLRLRKGCAPVDAPKKLPVQSGRRSPAEFSGVWLSG